MCRKNAVASLLAFSRGFYRYESAATSLASQDLEAADFSQGGKATVQAQYQNRLSTV